MRTNLETIQKDKQLEAIRVRHSYFVHTAMPYCCTTSTGTRPQSWPEQQSLPQSTSHCTGARRQPAPARTATWWLPDGAGSTSHLPLPSGRRTAKEICRSRSGQIHGRRRRLLFLGSVTATGSERRRRSARPARTCWRRRRLRRRLTVAAAGSRAGARPRRRRGGPHWGRPGATPPSSWRRTACAGTGSSSCTIHLAQLASIIRKQVAAQALIRP